MELLEVDRLVLFIMFVVPGFVSLKVYEQLFPAIQKNTSDLLVDAVAYSCINYSILAWPILSIEYSGLRESHLQIYLAFYAFVLFVAPISWVCVLKKIRTSEFFKASLLHPAAKPWDYVFGLRKEYWIVVTLKDGEKIGGRYSINSFASSAPAVEQLYLEETWHLNEEGGFDRVKEDSAGVIILTADIATVELFNITYGDVNEQQEHQEVTS